MADDDPEPWEPSADDPAEALAEIVIELHRHPDDEHHVSMIGIGPIESLFHQGLEDALWPEIERLARDDRVFRRALRSVWAYDSPAFERREALLEELGEFRTTWVRFVVEPTTLASDVPLSWRAIEVEGSVPSKELARLLREIADRLERDER